ncbi:MAG: hypothetical protein HYR56_19860 [Acidobacteria bacterium]|nr:hypothetical protein [Acidobacteriota bacterium]MBI3421900.1 hypothetical protein [Acidobacteriota bacterium]
MFVVRSLVLVCALAVLAFGQTVAGDAGGAARSGQSKQVNYVQVEAAQLLQRPAAYRGRRVVLTAEVVSVNARRAALAVYDARTHALIGVSLTELSKTQRRQLIAEPVYHVTIYGLAEMQEGRLVLKAEQVMPVEMTQVVR